MLKFFKSLFGGNTLESTLSETKSLKIKGVKFKIKKISILEHLDGSKVMLQVHDIYKTGNTAPLPDATEKKIKEHFSHVLVSGVMEPTLSHKNDGSGFFVERLFVDWDLVNELYTEIIALTYGKKKLRQNILQGQG